MTKTLCHFAEMFDFATKYQQMKFFFYQSGGVNKHSPKTRFLFILMGHII